MLAKILSAYFNDDVPAKIQPFGSGLINHTWVIERPEKRYILQRINDKVFKTPGNIADNIALIGAHLRQHHPGYFFVSPVRSLSGDEMIHDPIEGYFRLFPFVEGSHSIDVVQDPSQAYEAARQFGRFTKLLSNLDVSQLKVTIPQFHDLSLRYEQFRDALSTGNKQRIDESSVLIDKIQWNKDILLKFESIKNDPAFRLRVTHHDTKISNVLFDAHDKGICVIDLDTVMPGYFISDMGDMMRTYLSPVSEEETDLDKIMVREEFYEAIVKGYLEEMESELSMEEKAHFIYSGKFMIYMQALRFLTDHLNDDVYYGARYEGHNFMRAANQLRLLECLVEKEAILTSAVS